ncbi:UDP-N-acetylglucosamine 2-epimerase [Brevibacillus sp. FSL K6-0770]|uniref:UDP-N-acetylglucosamine 2-epimerase n=1 Tax=Brevibacillus TaxID=55080 RepID=UPI000ED160FA|nr:MULTISPECIES: UDP-N-acetylglucosamine 2-epimerase [Brevibacillus]MDH6350871.1 GDP/UDP-N,N'-diacetylbacillosamine 2-epimerase (hydrolyzing) [Brevibacillus sp. 1238]MDR4997931.1 UDP-N-acetylglucosamine 2-epimerase [Brevibacillus parabrevis]NRQ53473.1 UDP-N-acetylglucosamine 2-epimerase (hydrolyzing) [Brevibacillus sp. HD1.4A]HBZ81751.1 UDP-N-acetylglucosamine 2-epimerase (hydrolyzing) [Brevibacillus sp.]
MKKRKVLGVTGIRSEYDIMSSVYCAIESHPNLELELIVTGAHLSDAYGLTVNEIKQDGFFIAEEIESLINGDQASARVKGLAIQLQGLVQAVNRIKPDFLLVLGDREESMTTALVGAYMNIPVAHVAGGDRVVGNVDDQVRHAVSKLAHLHFVTNEESATRLLKMGEQSFRVYNTGNPGLDRIRQTPVLSRKELSTRLGFTIEENEPLLLLIQHIISTEINEAYFQMKQTMEAVKELGIKTILSYPNSDAGSQQLIKAIQEYQDLPYLYMAKNIPRLEFVNIMREASCMIGNSSAGILEAPLLHLPVINIGNRQKGRLHAENVQFVPHSVPQICSAVIKAISDRNYREQVKNCVNPYGDGFSSQKIANVLADIPIDDNLLVKDITY